MGDNSGKLELIPHNPSEESWGPSALRYLDEPASISLLVGNGSTKATIYSWSERMISHTGTETRPRLLREAAVGNIGQWAKA